MVFHYINENVKPLRAALAQANAELKAAMDKLNTLRNRLAVSMILIDVPAFLSLSFSSFERRDNISYLIYKVSPN